MKHLSPFFDESSVKTVGSEWFEVEMKNEDTFKSIGGWILIDVPHHIRFKEGGQSEDIGLLSTKCKMEPCYTQSSTNKSILEAIRFHLDEHVLTLKTKSS